MSRNGWFQEWVGMIFGSRAAWSSWVRMRVREEIGKGDMSIPMESEPRTLLYSKHFPFHNHRTMSEVMEQETKVCRECGAEKPTTEFYSHPTTKDRLFADCMECHRRKMLERYHRKVGNILPETVVVLSPNWRNKVKVMAANVRADMGLNGGDAA